MERDENDSVPKPHFLKGILHFDLSTADRYEEEYKKLVKRLYGVETYVKPQLGNTPRWVTEDTPITGSKRTAIQNLKRSNNPRSARLEFIDLLNGVKSKVLAFDSQESNYVLLYEEMLPIREEYLQIIKASSLIEDNATLLGDFFQEMYSGINLNSIPLQDIKQVYLHEIFVYTIAIKAKGRDYDSLSYILNRSYFGNRYGSSMQEIGFGIFYHYSPQLDNAKNNKDNKNYNSGTAKQWIDNLATDYCNKREFAFADVLLCNYAFFGSNYGSRYPWFPLTYLYDSENNSILQDVACQLRSKEIALRWAKIFGFDDCEQFRNKIVASLNEMNTKSWKRPRYPMSFYDVQLISDFIMPEEIGTLR